MDWVFDDGGRSAAGFTGFTGDCVTRAIAIAAELPYEIVYDEIKVRKEAFYARTRSRKRLTRTGKPRSASPRDGVYKDVYHPYLEELGWQWTPTMFIGSGARVHLCADELPSGRLVVACSRHLVAVINGIVHDTYDPSRGGTRAVYGFHSMVV